MITPELIAQLKKHEGFRSRIYKCTAGKYTWGYGENIDNEVRSGRIGLDERIGRDDAEKLLIRSIEQSQEQLFKAFPEFHDLRQARIDSLTNLVFNIGIGSFKGFKNMMRAIRHGDFDKATKEMLDSKWRKDVGPTRSMEVSNQLRTGDYWT